MRVTGPLGGMQRRIKVACKRRSSAKCASISIPQTGHSRLTGVGRMTPPLTASRKCHHLLKSRLKMGGATFRAKARRLGHMKNIQGSVRPVGKVLMYVDVRGKSKMGTRQCC